MQCLSNLENSGIIQHPTGSHSVLDKMEYNLFFILVKRVWDLREDFERAHDPMESLLNLEKILQDSR